MKFSDIHVSQAFPFSLWQEYPVDKVEVTEIGNDEFFKKWDREGRTKLTITLNKKASNEYLWFPRHSIWVCRETEVP